MKKFDLPFWKESPFIRLVIPFILGIAFSFYTSVAESAFIVLILFSFGCHIIFSGIALQWQFRFQYVNGILLNMMIIGSGALLASLFDPYNSLANIEQFDHQHQSRAPPLYTVSIREPPSEKKSSWKALSFIRAIQAGDDYVEPRSYIIVYFRKDSAFLPPAYGTRIAFCRQPERIKNFVPNSAFDYQRYCALKNIHYQVFLQPSEYVEVPGNDSNEVDAFLFRTQSLVLGILRNNIEGSKECGLAEALLIGYKNDLDKNLIQSYGNTGVVHVVAISGLHLGLIYGILNMLCRPFTINRAGKILRPLIVLSGLWVFSLLAGGSPSVLRSAVMFSSMVIGESFSRKTSLLNSLAASAFFLLCYNPYWLWDLGFILSYAALLSIAIFMKPVYGIFSPENKIVDAVWKMNAVTLSAQVLTMPVLVYSFKQFPNLFLVTNFLAIPLSGIILIGEIGLCSVYFIQPIALFTGKMLEVLIGVMNGVVEYVDRLPFSSTREININYLQVVLLYVFIGFISRWLILKCSRGLTEALVALIIFFLAGSLKTWQ
jgi:competence protein ComEC